jgi:DEAD/DEAH box helicase domain-containing protein
VSRPCWCLLIALDGRLAQKQCLAYPGGIGFSEPLFRIHKVLLQQTRELIVHCACEKGCPSCVGPAGDKSTRTKEAALAILGLL